MVLHITPEERSMLQLLATGKTGSEIAGHIGANERELERRLTALFARMGVATRVEAVNDARRRGLLTRDDNGDRDLQPCVRRSLAAPWGLSRAFSSE